MPFLLIFCCSLTLANPIFFTSFDFIGIATAINDNGHIVGNLGPINGGPAVFWDGTAFTEIKRTGWDYITPQGINNAGQVVGSYYDFGTGGAHGFSLAGGSFNTYDYPGYLNTYLNGVNDSGDVVGAFGSSAGTFLVSGGVETWIQHGPYELTASDINNGGAIVGTAIDTRYHGFVDDGGVFSIFDFPGAVDTYAFGVNDAGFIVGRWDDSSGTRHGFVKMGSTYLSVDYPGATELWVMDINNHNQFVGFRYTDGSPHGFLGTATPEPGTAFLMVPLAAIFVLRRRFRCR